MSIKKHFVPGEEYQLEEFVGKARIALNMASDRVEAAFGYPCSKAMQRVVPKGISHFYKGDGFPRMGRSAAYT